MLHGKIGNVALYRIGLFILNVLSCSLVEINVEYILQNLVRLIFRVLIRRAATRYGLNEVVNLTPKKRHYPLQFISRSHISRFMGLLPPDVHSRVRTHDRLWLLVGTG